MANSEVVRTPEIDPERSNYRSFWSKDWAKQILDTTKGTDIEQITIDLVISWRCQSEVLASPDTFVEVVYRMISSYQRPAGWQKIAKALADNLKKEVPSLTKQQVVELFTAWQKFTTTWSLQRKQNYRASEKTNSGTCWSTQMAMLPSFGFPSWDRARWSMPQFTLPMKIMSLW